MRHRGTVLSVALVLVLFAPGIWWGLPFIDGREAERGWAVDDETPLGALAEARQVFVRGGERNYGYPLFYYYISVAAYTPYLGYLLATNQFSKPTDRYPFGLANDTHALRVMSLISKGLTLLLAMAVVYGAYHAARLTWTDRAGVFAAILVALLYPLAYYARTGNVDVPMLGLSAIGLAAYCAIARDGITTRRAVTLGAAAGLAMATKDSAVGLFAAVPLAMFAVPRPSGTAFPWRTWGIAAVAGFVALGIGSGLFIDPVRYYYHLMELVGRLDSVPRTASLYFALPNTAAGHLAALKFQAVGSMQGLTFFGLMLAVAGIALFVPGNRQARLLLLPALTYSAFVFFFLRAEQLRYLLPLGFVLALFAGAAADAGTRSPVRIRAAAAWGLLAAAISISTLRLADLTHAMVRDSRYEAAEWLATRLAPGDRVEFFGASQKLPRLPAGVVVERAAVYQGMHTLHDTSAAHADSIVAGWMTRRPTMVIVIPDHSRLFADAPFDGSMPPALFRRLESGELPWRRAARFETPPLLPLVRRPGLDYPVVNPPVHIYAPSPAVQR